MMDFNEVVGSQGGPNNPPGYANNQPNYPSNGITINNNINSPQQSPRAPYQTGQVPPPAHPNQQPAQLPGFQQQQQPAANCPDMFRNLIGVWKIEHQTGYKEYLRVGHVILKLFSNHLFRDILMT